MRPAVLIGLLVALAGTAWVASQDDAAEVAPVRRGGKAGATSRASARGAASAPATPEDVWYRTALSQGVTMWQARPTLTPWPPTGPSAWSSQRPPPPPPPPVIAEAPPPPPMAPNFPHAWVGRFNDEATERAIVSGPNATWVVHAGDVIEGQWRIDQINERQMQLTYLPLKQSQLVSMKAP
ncbi:MAG: hypothetical protein KGL90_06545 [Burkholderiales bacterium]|nr:hypothetical protein [Burkholderiales bacterium]